MDIVFRYVLDQMFKNNTRLYRLLNAIVLRIETFKQPVAGLRIKHWTSMSRMLQMRRKRF